eukprot:SAG31_NODE_360_length_17025_cov_5.362460_1_plen_508_part_00
MSGALWAWHTALLQSLGKRAPPSYGEPTSVSVVYFDPSEDCYCPQLSTDRWLAEIQAGGDDEDTGSGDTNAPTAGLPPRARRSPAAPPARFQPSQEPNRVTRFETVPAAQAFAESGCEYDSSLNLSALPNAMQGTVRSALSRAYPGDETGLDKWAHVRKAMINGGSECLRIKVVRIVDPRHPVRVFTTPDAPAFGVVATKDYEEDEIIMPYHGNLITEAEATAENFYLYEMTAGLGDAYDGPALFVDPKDRGNESRFVNDQWAPKGMRHQKANAYAKLFWDPETKLPHIFILAGKPCGRSKMAIRKGTEILYDYGIDGYWRLCWRSMMQEHAEFAAKTMHLCLRLQDHLTSLGVKDVPKVNIPGLVATAGTPKPATAHSPITCTAASGYHCLDPDGCFDPEPDNSECFGPEPERASPWPSRSFSCGTCGQNGSSRTVLFCSPVVSAKKLPELRCSECREKQRLITWKNISACDFSLWGMTAEEVERHQASLLTPSTEDRSARKRKRR